MMPLNVSRKRLANEKTENIGARRLHTVMEKLMEEISFDASEKAGSTLTIDANYVEQHLGALVEDEDLSRFILNQQISVIIKSLLLEAF